MLALVIGPVLGVILVLFRRTRVPAQFLLVLPSAAAGGGIFGFWVWLRPLAGRLSEPAAMEGSFYLGCLPFYALGAALALLALLYRRHVPNGNVVRLGLPAVTAAFVALGYLGLAVSIREWIELHRMAARMGGGFAGWDPVSYIKSASSGLILASMLLAFAAVFMWKSRQPRLTAG